jgi:hypothetical protein
MTNHHAHDSSSNLWLTGVIGSASSAQAPEVGALNGANSVRWEHDILMDRSLLWGGSSRGRATFNFFFSLSLVLLKLALHFGSSPLAERRCVDLA